MELIDIGVNLTHDSFDADRDAVIQRARDAGVVQMIVTGSSEDSTRKAIELSHAYPSVLFATSGVHPHHASDVTAEMLAQIERLAREKAVVAVGECGLDYFRDLSPRDVQRRAFEQQLEIAARVGKPVFLHQRDAHEDFVAILREHRAKLVGGVAHCFTAGEKERDAYLELGLHIGITGWICDERRGMHLREVVKGIPEDRLMIETDAPYLIPRDLKPMPKTRRNEPMWLPQVADVTARAKGKQFARMALEAATVTRQFFSI